MGELPSLCHVASVLCAVTPERILRHLTSAEGMRCWCLGMMECAGVKPNQMRGQSLFDGSEG